MRLFYKYNPYCIWFNSNFNKNINMYIPNELYISGFINIFIIYLIYLVINSLILIIGIFLIKYIFFKKNNYYLL